MRWSVLLRGDLRIAWRSLSRRRLTILLIAQASPAHPPRMPTWLVYSNAWCFKSSRMLNNKMFYNSYWVIWSGSWRIRSLCIHAYSFPFYNGLLHYALWHMPTSYWLSCLLMFTYAQPHPSIDLVYKGLCYIPIILTLLRRSQSLLS